MWECLRCLEDGHTDAISPCGYFGHVKCGGQGQKAVELFQQMQPKGMQPKSVTFVAVLNVCAIVFALEEG